METKDLDNYLVNGMDRGLKALLLFLDEPEMSFSSFVRHANLNKATAKRILFTLETNGFIRYDPETSLYSLGSRVFELGTAASRNLKLLKVAQPYMESLCNQVNETVLISKRVDNDQLYLLKLEGEGRVQLPTLVGRRRPLYYGLGKVILAYLCPDDRLKCVTHDLPMYGINTISDRDEFIATLDQIVAQGYGVDDEEYIEGVVGIGAPIFANQTEIVGVVGVVAPSKRLPLQKREEVIKLVVKAGKAISLKL